MSQSRLIWTRLAPALPPPQASELLETALKRFEDLEFQQLERESRREEEREAASAALACEIARLQRTVSWTQPCLPSPKLGPGGSVQGPRGSSSRVSPLSQAKDPGLWSGGRWDPAPVFP